MPFPTDPTSLCRGVENCLLRGGKRTLLPARLLDLGGEANADQPVVGLELLHRLGGVVDEGKAGGLAATELGPEAEDADLVLLGLVQAGELVAELLLGDVGAVRVEDITVRESVIGQPPSPSAQIRRAQSPAISSKPPAFSRAGPIEMA